MALLKKIGLFLFTIYALITFVIAMLLVFPFAMLAITGGKVKGGNLVYRCCRIWAQLWYYTIGVRHKEIYEHPHNSQPYFLYGYPSNCISYPSTH